MMHPRFLLFLFATTFVLTAQGQKMQTAAGEAPGPWILGTVGVGQGPDAKTPKTTALKGLAIKVGEKGEAAVAYDLDLCRMVGAWTGKFTTPMNLMSRGEYPTAMGEVAFTTGEIPGFIAGEGKEAWKDPRAEPFGPLPLGQARFKGFYVNGNKTIIKWDIGGTEVLEMPGATVFGGRTQVFRAFTIAAHQGPVLLNLSNFTGDGSIRIARSAGEPKEAVLNGRVVYSDDGKRAIAWRYFTDSKIAELEDQSGGRPLRSQDVLLMPSGKETWFVAAACTGTKEQVEATFGGNETIDLPEPKNFAVGGQARWRDPVTTQGELSKDTESAYVVDTIKLPDPNPWSAPMFVGGFDFFPDGRAAVCTFHGDVFIVSGLDEKLEKVTWKRFASGLYHALGLKIVNGEIYVTCRDGIWRLKDLNNDGEADFYEAFNFDVKVTKSFHEFVFDLQTDPQGNFYFAKAGPVKNGGRGFDQIMEHHGCLFRVSPDGAKLNVIATGFRAPNGIGVGPRGEVTTGDNEGTWTPACKINWIKPGGFYGVVDLAHRDPPPTDYDRPLCWLPKRVDNSGGGQVWVPEGDRWGPWGGQLLHLSYGQSSLYGVLREEVRAKIPGAGQARHRGLDVFVSARLITGGKPNPAANEEPEEIVELLPPPNPPELAQVAAPARVIDDSEIVQQGGVTKFPLQFQSGIMRGRFNPKDGQLYVAGLRGWQTTGLKNGCFQRVRYTGAVAHMPIELHVKKDGLELRFTSTLDTQTARDPENWHLEQWRYLWSSAYGSPELSTEADLEAPAEVGKDGRAEFTKAQASKTKHDPVSVKSVTIGTDDRSVFLEIPGLKPVMQMSIKYDLKTSDGKDLRGEVVNTIHALGKE
jgi:hypothetical protein